jgi:hypothetical protein
MLPGSRKYWNLENDTQRLLYIVLILSADDAGRLEGTPEDVKTYAPRSQWSIKTIKKSLKALEKNELIVRYDGYIQIAGFVENQLWSGVTERGSNIPAPPGLFSTEVLNSTVRDAVQHSQNTHDMHDMHAHHILSSHEERESEGEGDFRLFRKKWKHIIGKAAQATTTNRKLFAADCQQYGQDVVLRRIDPWSEEQDEEFLKGPIAAWKYLKEGVHDVNESETGPTRRRLTKAEKVEAANDEAFNTVFGRPKTLP